MSPSPRLRWVMIALVFVATAINYLDRQTLSVVAPVLIDLYHMSNEAYARIVFAFMLAYTVMNGVSGQLIDLLRNAPRIRMDNRVVVGCRDAARCHHRPLDPWDFPIPAGHGRSR